MALGCAHPTITLKYFEQIFTELSLNCEINVDKDEDDSETRKYSVKSIENIMKTWLTGGQEDRYLEKTLDIFSRTVEDYSVDKRGDIGSVVREQTMESLYQVLLHLKSIHKLSLLSQE